MDCREFCELIEAYEHDRNTGKRKRGRNEKKKQNKKDEDR
jgi:hypothetical protein